MPGVQKQYSIAAPGLARFRRDMGRISTELRRAFDAEIRLIASNVRDEARARAPVGQSEYDPHPGQLRSSLRYSLARGNAVIYSTLVYAPIQEFGWPAHNIEGRFYMAGAVEAEQEHVIEALEALLDEVAARGGFHGALI